MKSKSGFTIVELLIVIVVIGILAAISVMAYGNIKNRAQLAVFTSDVVAIKKAMELFKAENGDYPFCPGTGGRQYDEECTYNPAIRQQLDAIGATNLPTYNFNFVHLNYGDYRYRWAMLYPGSASYNGVARCKFGTSMDPGWYNSAPEC